MRSTRRVARPPLPPDVGPQCRSGVLNGAGSSPVACTSHVLDRGYPAPKNALLVRRCFQMSGHVILAPPRNANTVFFVPRFLHGSRFWRSPRVRMPKVLRCILHITVRWTNLCNGSDNECVVQQREKSLISGAFVRGSLESSMLLLTLEHRPARDHVAECQPVNGVTPTDGTTDCDNMKKTVTTRSL